MSFAHAPNQGGNQSNNMGHINRTQDTSGSYARPKELISNPENQESPSKTQADTEQGNSDQGVDQRTLVSVQSLDQSSTEANQAIVNISAHGPSHCGASTALHIHLEV